MCTRLHQCVKSSGLNPTTYQYYVIIRAPSTGKTKVLVLDLEVLLQLDRSNPPQNPNPNPKHIQHDILCLSCACTLQGVTMGAHLKLMLRKDKESCCNLFLIQFVPDFTWWLRIASLESGMPSRSHACCLPWYWTSMIYINSPYYQGPCTKGARTLLMLFHLLFIFYQLNYFFGDFNMFKNSPNLMYPSVAVEIYKYYSSHW